MSAILTKYSHKLKMPTGPSVSKKQRGLALPLTLMLLFAMTLIAVTMLRVSTLEENMSANSRLRQIAFNAGESTLTEAERFVQSLSGSRRRDLFFGNGIIAPKATVANVGDTCTDGFCTPAKYTSPVSVQPSGERWEDTVLDVWGDDDKHIKYANYANSNLENEGVIETPQYIIEFLGNYDYRTPNLNLASDSTARPKFNGEFLGNCRDQDTNALTPPNDVWPFCASDPAVYRITVRATAGPSARQAVVFMQSTLQVPH